MKINLVSIARKALRNLDIEDLGRNKIKICYKSNYKIAQPKSIVIPKFIKLDEEFSEAIGLYLGDGKLTPFDSTHLEYTTIDEDIGKFMLEFFLNRLNVKTEDITFTIRYRFGKENELRRKWSKILGIPPNRLYIRKLTKYRMRDSISFQINSVIFRKIFQNLVESVLPIIRNKKKLRQAFLRGEFAADGKIGIEKAVNTYYISEISFCYDAKKEIWLRDYIIDILKAEGISNFNVTNGYIRVTNWKNYVKFWKMRLFDKCKRKKDKFLNVVKQMEVRLRLNLRFLRKFLGSTGLSNREIRKIINLHRTNLKRVLNGSQLLKLEQIYKLLQFSSFKWRDVIRNANLLRIGRNTNLRLENDFIHFLLREKNLN